MAADQNYSVLMSVYKKEKAEYLRISMNSIYVQTVPTDDFVLVCDGPLTPELDRVIEEMQNQFGQVLQVIRLEENQGLGRALNQGMKYCRNEWIARMDSDDISYPDRCERQLKVLAEQPEIAIISGTVEEFQENPDEIRTSRVLPLTSGEILAFARKRNPFNHPAVMYRKSAVETAGGYQDFYLLEDYYLWIRMLKAGFRGCNIREPLVKMRAGDGMYQRRAGFRYAYSQARLFLYMKKIGWIGSFSCLKSIMTRTIGSLIPNQIRKFIFEKTLRRKSV